jgi:hypothetical protein
MFLRFKSHPYRGFCPFQPTLGRRSRDSIKPRTKLEPRTKLVSYLLSKAPQPSGKFFVTKHNANVLFVLLYFVLLQQKYTELDKKYMVPIRVLRVSFNMMNYFVLSELHNVPQHQGDDTCEQKDSHKYLFAKMILIG